MDTKDSVYDDPPPPSGDAHTPPADGTNGGAASTDPNGGVVPTDGNKTVEQKQGENIDQAKDGAKTDDPNNPNKDKNKKPDANMDDTIVQFYGYKNYEEFKAAKKKADDEYVAEVGKYIYGQNLSDGQIKNMLGSFTPATAARIYGMPYQWMPEVDRRVQGTGQFGRKFYEKILTKMPILVLTPGLPDFMGGYGKEDKVPLMQALVAGSGVSLDTIKSSNNRPLRYYTLKFATSQYYDYVNSMCTALAVFLGIDKVNFHGSPIGDIMWQDTNEISKLYSYHGGVGFYLNSETQLSESFSNESTQSKLGGMLNGLSSTAKEIQFLTGISGVGTDLFLSGNMAEDPANIKSLVDVSKLGNFGDFIGMLANGTRTVFNGGKLEFPELWEDSSYSSNYNISLKLISPDYDKVSWFINIGVPLMHLIALACPRQVDPNGYVSPFLCRAFYKGFFNIDMGLLTLSVQRGTEGGWTVDGLPTVVEISLEIKDLYNNMSISHSLIKSGESVGALDNMAMMTYLANMAGVNINEPDISRSLKLYASMAKREIFGIPTQILTKANQYMADLLTNRIWINGSIK